MKRSVRILDTLVSDLASAVKFLMTPLMAFSIVSVVFSISCYLAHALLGRFALGSSYFRAFMSGNYMGLNETPRLIVSASNWTIFVEGAIAVVFLGCAQYYRHLKESIQLNDLLETNGSAARY